MSWCPNSASTREHTEAAGTEIPDLTTDQYRQKPVCASDLLVLVVAFRSSCPCCLAHLFTNHRRRNPLCINASRPLLPEHGIGKRCCCLVSVNVGLSLIHISEPTRRTPISYA